MDPVLADLAAFFVKKVKGLRSTKRPVPLSPAAPASIGLYLLA
jgi:hypothetical protein